MSVSFTIKKDAVHHIVEHRLQHIVEDADGQKDAYQIVLRIEDERLADEMEGIGIEEQGEQQAGNEYEEELEAELDSRPVHLADVLVGDIEEALRLSDDKFPSRRESQDCQHEAKEQQSRQHVVTLY